MFAAWSSTDPAERRGYVFAAFAIAVLFSVVVPRIGPLVVVSISSLIVIALLAGDNARDRSAVIKRTILRPEMLFALWALIAVTWSPEFTRGLGKALLFFALLLHALILADKFHLMDSRDVRSAAQGIVAGFIIGGIYVCLEIDSRDSLTRFVLTHFPELERAVPGHTKIEHGEIVKMSGAHITRVAAVFCLFICPTLLAASLYTRGAWKWACYAATAVFLLLVFFHPHTHSQTAQLVVPIAVATLALAFIAPRLGQWAVAAGFAAWLFLIIPGSLAMYSYGLHENEDLFRSARARILIWQDTTKEVMKHPVFGAGTEASRAFEETPETREKISKDDLGGGLGGRRHPHNIYLQIWYELGTIGVLAFAWLGFSLWSRIRRLPKNIAAFATTQFAVCATIIGPSYSMWQNWFQSAFVMSILAVVLLANASLRSQPPDHAED